MKDINIKIDQLLKAIGYQIVEINNMQLYFQKIYLRFTYIEDFKAYVLESANSYEEAYNNLFEDGDIYPISLNESDLLEKIKFDLVNYYQ